MPEKSANQQAKVSGDKTSSDATKKRIEALAGKAALKASKTEQHYDIDHNIFSK